MATIQTTNRSLDVAIDGDGAFVLRDPRTGIQVLSRLGHLDIDAQGRLVNDEGWVVEGAVNGQPAASLAALVPLASISTSLPPVATRQVSIEANLDARIWSVGLGSMPNANFDPTNPNTFMFATTVNLYDAAGQVVSLTLYFRAMGPSLWHVHASANGVAVPAQAAGQPQPLVALNFRSDGSAAIDPGNASLALRPIKVDIPATIGSSGRMTAALPAVALDLSRLTGYATSFGVTALDQDGSAREALTSASITPTGELQLGYGNFRSDTSRRLVLARTTVADRLNRYGASGWICGLGCQSPVMAQPGQMLTGKLVAGALNAGN